MRNFNNPFVRVSDKQLTEHEYALRRVIPIYFMCFVSAFCLMFILE